MVKNTFPFKLISKKELNETARYIAKNQYPSGAIPWFKKNILDPWDHVEAAMGLSIAGFIKQAKKAFMWMAKMQEPDGGFWPAYDDTVPLDKSRKESHHAPYLATGLYHYFLITKDIEFLYTMWEHVEAAIEFALNLQSLEGEIYWALLPENKIYKDSLITGCSSIYKSIESAILIARKIGISKPKWIEAREELKLALTKKPHRFDRTWPSKNRFAMDWFYPVMCGVIRGNQARKRINEKWSIFVEQDLGCRCVSDEPWITVAESSELVIALLGAGMNSRAIKLFNWLHKNRDKDGAYWTGYQKELKIFWPEEKPTWTAGVLLLAADALLKLTPASNLFLQNWLITQPQIKKLISVKSGVSRNV
ncbi:hypothetical protein [Desulfothermus sp.]